MNIDTVTQNAQQLLAVIPYTTPNTPDERGIQKTVRCYANLNWQMVNRRENLETPEYGQFSLLQFKYEM